jgi:hypothetical protein
MTGRCCLLRLAKRTLNPAANPEAAGDSAVNVERSAVVKRPKMAQKR